MSTDTQPVAALLEEAEAIVEAEWMRLTLDGDIDECALIAPFAETPAPLPRHAQRWPARRWPGPPVRATQRSPPAHTTLLVE
jgi:hypothetical protein